MPQSTAATNDSRLTLLAGSVVSLLLHGSLLLLATLVFRGCRPSSIGQPGGEVFREVGLYVVDGADGGRSDAGIAAGEGNDSSSQHGSTPKEALSPAEQSDDSSGLTDAVPDTPPDVQSLLGDGDASARVPGESHAALPNLIGPGDPLRGTQRPAPGGGGSTDQNTTAGGKARLGGPGGRGQTTFMNIADVGRSVVYVIDTSSSMDGGRFKVAQGQLKASLRLLDGSQKFAVIFYNEAPTVLKLRNAPSAGLYAASDLNKSLAIREIDRAVCGEGTRHLPALLQAVDMQPDVMYFLTDGAEPALSAGELSQILKAGSGTTIHAIQFSDGRRDSRERSWMERLTEQAGGQFLEIRVD
jgi:Ca-activated chloride channel family protein